MRLRLHDRTLRFYCRDFYWNFSGGVMMILRRDVNLDCFTQAVGGLPMESLKQAMLQHEFIFRNQVRELHRLYWTQKNLMNEVLQNGLEVHAPHRPSVGAWSACNEFLVEKKAFSISCLARQGSLVREVDALEEFKDKSANLFGTNQINFGIHLPSDDFIPITGEEPAYKQLGRNASTGTELVDAIDKGNLGIGLGHVFIEESMHLPINCKEVSGAILECPEAENVLLSGSKVTLQKVNGVFGFQPTAPCVWSSSSTLLNNAHLVPTILHLNGVNIGRLHEEKNTLPVDVVDKSSVATSINQSITKKQATPLLIDLNIAQEDESSTCPSYPIADNTFVLSSCAVYEGGPIHELNNSCPVEASSALKLGSSYTATNDYCNKEADSLAHTTKTVEVTAKTILVTGKTDCMSNVEGLASACQVPTLRCKELPLKESNASAAPVFPSINLVSFPSTDWDEPGKNIVDFRSGKQLSSTHCDCKRMDSNITSSSITNLTQTATRDSADKLCNAYSSLDASTRPPAAFSITDDSVTTQLNSSKAEGYTSAKLNQGQDITIATAAEALMNISSGKISIPTGQFDGIQVEDDESEDWCNQVQCSSDSFECMTLQLSEIRSEDQLMLPEPLSVNKAGKNDISLSLRRGRGLRDFQKEILPGLVSLSRHEICEDLHNIGYNLRRVSCRSSGANWFLPVRSRRSRLCSGLRRH
ncbi:hypothetical protein HPP92_007187 [Vanilla planifolia]|uniref:Uncharacterized protein n=1 Tax=Vanilla planifolia TaxID=51239 RepID=A0A835RFR3_VANPL|nr:hypothetical protein HPP92_007187 [Vanilla planifolia]